MKKTGFKAKAGLYLLFLVMLVLLFFGMEPGLMAQEEKERRPRIGLVLSGGGARGLAHVGVIKKLEEYGISVDYVVGTSMGSLVGGLYAGGYSSGELEKTALSIDWDEYLSDTMSRRYLSFDEKQDDGRFIISLPFDRDGISPITGLIEGVKMRLFLNRLLFQVNGKSDFSELPVPFACVATDIYTGEAVILKNGNLPAAMRASMSIPSVFTSVEIDGRMLVDGGLVINLPVSVAKDMGADTIIGVDVGTPLAQREESLSIPQIIDQIASFRGAESTRKQRQLCDILITPDLEGISAIDFDKTARLISIGESAAAGHEEELREIARQQAAYEPEKREKLRKYSPQDKVHIDRIRVEGLSRVSRQFVENRLQLKVPGDIRLKDIDEAVLRTYGSRFFRTVSYRIDERPGKRVLVIEVKEAATNFINIGMRYDSDIKAAVLLSAEFQNLLGEGSRLDIEARLGENHAFNAGYSKVIGWPVRFGFGTDLWFEQIDVYSYFNSEMSGEYRFNRYGGSIFADITIYHDFVMGVGLKKEFAYIDKVIAMNEFSQKTLDYLNPYVFMSVDTLDRACFPHSGIKLEGEAMYISNEFSFYETELPEDIQRYYLNTWIYLPMHRRLTIFFTHFIGVLRGDECPLVYYFSLGGMNVFKGFIYPFVGLDYMEETGRNINALGAGLQYEVLKNFYLQFRVNGARVKKSLTGVLSGNVDTVYGCGVTAGYLSVIGPIELTVSSSSTHDINYHFNVGFKF